MIVIVSGNAGSGKSVLVERLAKKFKLRKVFASSILKGISEGRNFNFKKLKTKKGEGFFESKKGTQLSKARLSNFSLDKELDKALLKILKEHDNLIVDSRLMPWLYKKPSVKIWISASMKTRARRTAHRDKISVYKAMKALKERSAVDRKIYKKLYKINYEKDLKPFDLILKTDKLTKKQTFLKAKKFIEATI